MLVRLAVVFLALADAEGQRPGRVVAIARLVDVDGVGAHHERGVAPPTGREAAASVGGRSGEAPPLPRLCRRGCPAATIARVT